MSELWICDHESICGNSNCLDGRPPSAHLILKKACPEGFQCFYANAWVKPIPYKEEKEMALPYPPPIKKKYESLKPISIHALSKTVTCGSEMRKFTLMYIHSYEWKGEIPLAEIEKHFPHQPAWENHLIGHSFIKIVEPEVFYQIGEKFQKDGDSWTYSLNHSGNGWVCLSSMINCNCWAEAKKVVNIFRITQKEFRKICGTDNFTKI